MTVIFFFPLSSSYPWNLAGFQDQRKQGSPMTSLSHNQGYVINQYHSLIEFAVFFKDWLFSTNAIFMFLSVRVLLVKSYHLVLHLVFSLIFEFTSTPRKGGLKKKQVFEKIKSESHVSLFCFLFTTTVYTLQWSNAYIPIKYKVWDCNVTIWFFYFCKALYLVCLFFLHFIDIFLVLYYTGPLGKPQTSQHLPSPLNTTVSFVRFSSSWNWIQFLLICPASFCQRSLKKSGEGPMRAESSHKQLCSARCTIGEGSEMIMRALCVLQFQNGHWGCAINIFSDLFVSDLFNFRVENGKLLSKGIYVK